MTDAATRPATVPLTLLTGFLGAGKTTLLNRLLKDEALAETIVIVNEFGEIGLDHLLIEGVEESMILLESGCLCCTIRDDLIVTLEDLLRRNDNGRILPFKRVVIETTGLADPAPILNVLINHPYLALRFKLDGVLTLVDAINGMATLDAHEEARKQVIAADRIVLTKSELVAPDQAEALAALRERLDALNPGVLILPASAPAQELVGAGLYDLANRPDALRQWLAHEHLSDGHGQDHNHDHGHHHHDHDHHDHHHGHHHHDRNRHDASIRAFTLTSDIPVSEATFDLFWTLLRSTHGSKLLRLKGLVALTECPASRCWSMPFSRSCIRPSCSTHWPDDDHRSRLVMIVKDLDEEVVQRLWSAFLGQIKSSPAA